MVTQYSRLNIGLARKILTATEIMIYDFKDGWNVVIDRRLFRMDFRFVRGTSINGKILQPCGGANAGAGSAWQPRFARVTDAPSHELTREE